MEIIAIPVTNITISPVASDREEDITGPAYNAVLVGIVYLLPLVYACRVLLRLTGYLARGSYRNKYHIAQTLLVTLKVARKSS